MSRGGMACVCVWGGSFNALSAPGNLLCISFLAWPQFRCKEKKDFMRKKAAAGREGVMQQALVGYSFIYLYVYLSTLVVRRRWMNERD